MGSPGMNLLRGSIVDAGGGLVCRLGAQELGLSPTLLAARPGITAYRDRQVAVGIRPEHLQANPAAGRPTLQVKILLTEPLGAERLVHGEIAAPPVVTDDVLEIAGDIDATTLSALASEQQARLIGRVDATYEAQPDAIVSLGVETERLHFFDLETGAAIV